MVKSGQSISFPRVISQTLIASLAFILVITCGLDGLVIFPKYFMNVILIVLVGLGWLGWYIWRRRPFPSTPIDLPLWSWIAAVLIAVIASTNPRMGLETFAYYLVCVLIFYVLVSVERAGKSLETWITMLLAAGFLVFAFGYLEVGFWFKSWLDISGLEQIIPPATLRVQSTMGWSNYLAAYLNLLLPLAVVRLISSPSRGRKALWSVWCVAALVLIFFTSSRGGWLGTATALGSLAFLLAFDQRKKVKESWKWLLKRPYFLAGMFLTLMLLAVLVGGLLMRQVQHPSHSTRDPRGYMWSVAWAMFKSRPLIGTGPSTFATSFMRSYSVPPNTLMPHAHNLLLNLLGETGLLGAGTALWLGMMLVWVAIKRWRMEPPGKRTILAGSLAALAGLAVHSQFDVVQVVPMVTLVAVTIIAQLAAPFNSRKGRQDWRSILLIASWVAAMVVWVWVLWGYILFQRGLDAADKKDWVTAAFWVDEAVVHDPNLAFYRFQSGQIHARLALDNELQVQDSQQLKYAQAAYERGLQIDAAYSLDWASLGELRWAGGDRLRGIAAMEQAVLLAPGSPDLNLLLGQWYEESGQPERALEQYGKALKLQPDLVKISFFLQSATRLKALAAFSQPPPDPGWLALENGEYAQAESIFRSQLGLNDSLAYMGLGLSLLGEGNIVDAEKALRTAEFLVVNDLDALKAKVELIKLYDATGQEEKANSVRRVAESMSLLEDTDYNYYYSYHRYGLGDELLLSMVCEFCFKPVTLLILR